MKSSLWQRYCRYMGMTSLDRVTLMKTYANEHSKFVRIEGDDIHYRIEGRQDKNAPTILMLHGIMSSLHTWDGWVDEMKDDYRIIRIDVPAFGLTGPVSSNDYSISSIVSKMKALLDALDISEVILVGNSLGGYISWSFAAECPERVKSMILLDPAGYPMPFVWLMRLLVTPYLRHLIRFNTPKFVVNMTLKDVYGDAKKISADKVDLYHDMMLREGNRLSLIRIFEEIPNMSPEKVASINVPTLIMWGEDDKWIPLMNAYQFMRDLPNAELITYPGVGHIPMEEIPEQTAKDAKAFLEKVLVKPKAKRRSKKAATKVQPETALES